VLGALLLCLAAALAPGIAPAAAATGPASAAGPAAAAPAAQTSPDRVLATRVDSAITPVTADLITEGIERAEQGGYAGYVIQLDTPGGLARSMREIVENILASRVPVIVYVSPEGARAASAGAFITLASHVAVMAPGTVIGAATPVSGQGGDLSQKIVNDATAQARSLAQLRGREVAFAEAMVRRGASIGVSEAVQRGVVEARARSLRGALQAADGMRATLVAGRTVTIDTANATVDRADPGLLRQIQQWLANPNLTFILFMLGALGLLFELTSPGVGVAGVAGAVSLVLALFSAAILPVTVTGVMLLVLAVALFVAELFAPGIGVFAAGGAVASVLAGLFLFQGAEGITVDLAVIVPVAVLMAILAVIAGRVVVRSRRKPTTSSGRGLLTGQVVAVRDAEDGRGRAFLDGAWWNVRSTGQPLRDGTQARVVDLDGLTLVVEPAAGELPEQEG
jgi:membrane-bound serine protease (ClpP class)